MENNQITKLKANIFKGLTRLRVINLIDNKIKSIHRDSLAGSNNLFIVILSNNKLVDLPKGLFNTQPVRQEKVHFFFRGNKIQEIRKNLLLGSSDKFIHLGFSSNQITRIEEGAFEVLQALPGSIGIFICNNPIVENVLCHL